MVEGVCHERPSLFRHSVGALFSSRSKSWCRTTLASTRARPISLTQTLPPSTVSYDRPGRNTVNFMNGVNTSKSGKKDSYKASSETPAIAGYPRNSDFQPGDIVPSYTPDNTSTTNNMRTMNNTKTANSGTKVNCYRPPDASGIASYPASFRSSEIGSNFGPSKTNSRSNSTSMNTEKKMANANTGSESYYHQPAATPASATYSRDFQSAQMDSSFTQDMDAMYSTDGMKNANKNNTPKNGKKVNYHQPTAAPAGTTYSSAFQSGGVHSSCTDPMYTTSSENNTKRVNTAMNKPKGTYRLPTASMTATAHPSPFETDDIESGFAQNADAVRNTTSVNRANTATNGTKSSHYQPTTPPASARYPTTLRSGELDSSFTHNPDTMHRINSVNSAKTAKNAKEGKPLQRTAPSASTAYPSTARYTEIGTKPSYINDNTMYNTNSRNNVKTTSNGKTGKYNSTTAPPDNTSHPTALRSREIDTNSEFDLAAWEEHIDVATNKKYFYNNSTMRSTWEQPSEMVKRTPPPPPPPLTAPMFKKREQDQWFRVRDTRGRKMWYNEITRRSQVERPDCLRKYR